MTDHCSIQIVSKIKEIKEKEEQDDTQIVNIVIMLFGEKYENFFIESVNSMVENQTLDGTSLILKIWVPRNHLSRKFRDKIVNFWQCDEDSKEAKVCIDINFFSYKWFDGLFNHQRSIAEEIQLARIMLVPQLLPSDIKHVIIKDADQIMQSGNIADFLFGNHLIIS